MVATVTALAASGISTAAAIDYIKHAQQQHRQM